MMQSSGGTATVEAATERPVNLLMSGPVAGLIGGIWAGRRPASTTSSRSTWVEPLPTSALRPVGELGMRHLLDTKIGDYQAMVPMVDIDTIGAGGGSIAYVDQGGVFRVGPQSAGADPGPACYGRGGTEPTATDAQLVLGRLRPDRGLLGGAMALDLELAEEALARPVPSARWMTRRRGGARGAQIQKYGMTRAIEVNSVRRGYDPRDFTLVAAGGAGPLFACDIALELEIPSVSCPPTRHRGGDRLLATDLQHEFVATGRHPADSLDKGELEAALRRTRRARHRAARGGRRSEDRRLIRRLADCRYAGQGYEVRFDVPPGSIDDAWVRSWRNGSTGLTRPSTATGSTRRSRSSTCARSRSGVWTPRAVGAGAGRW